MQLQDMIALMKPGSVLVDLAAENGGNFETTRPGEVYVDENGVTHIGYIDLANRLPTQSSNLYANNVTKFLLSLGDKDNFYVNLEDEVVRGSIIVLDGRVLWPPSVISQPSPPATSTKPTDTKELVVAEEDPFRRALKEAAVYGTG